MDKKTLSLLNDENLVLLYKKNGSSSAFEILVERNAEDLRYYLLNLVRNEYCRTEIVEDLMQETFINTIEGIRKDRYDPTRGKFKTWLLGVSRNLAIDYFRREGKKVISLDLFYEPFSLNAEERLIETETNDNLRNLVGKLDEPQRKVIASCYFMELTMAETAKMQGVPLGTVKTRARAGLVALRKKLFPIRRRK